MNANRKSVRRRCATIAENQEPPFLKKQNNQPPLWRVVADRELLQSYCLLLFDHGTADYDAASGVGTNILELVSASADNEVATMVPH